MELLNGGWVTDGGLETDLIFNHGDELPAITVLGGCCGTDSRHVAPPWGVDR